jgi:glyoxylase-like metal-dependent hydrolase (beta-lactamase superfamily II)
VSDDLPRIIDLMHLGVPHALGALVHDGWLVDPGPERTLPALLAGLGDETPRGILLTHIHFDHAGSAGALAARFPHVEVWVHERGAPHIVDPTRLVRSARGVFGDHFDRLWGEVVPVPAERLRVVTGDEHAGPWQVAYTPGHAKHHVSYLHEPTGVAFTGDVTGIRISGGPAVPPTPPPDIDPPLWHASIARIAEWNPRALAYMHYGVSTDVPEHLADVDEALARFTEEARTAGFEQMTTFVREWVRARAAGDLLPSYGAAGPYEGTHGGLARYWQQVDEGRLRRP